MSLCTVKVNIKIDNIGMEFFMEKRYLHAVNKNSLTSIGGGMNCGKQLMKIRESMIILPGYIME